MSPLSPPLFHRHVHNPSHGQGRRRSHIWKQRPAGVRHHSGTGLFLRRPPDRSELTPPPTTTTTLLKAVCHKKAAADDGSCVIPGAPVRNHMLCLCCHMSFVDENILIRVSYDLLGECRDGGAICLFSVPVGVMLCHCDTPAMMGATLSRRKRQSF